VALYRALQSIAPYLDAASILHVCEGAGLVVGIRDDRGRLRHYTAGIAERLGLAAAPGGGARGLVARCFDERGRELGPAELPWERVRRSGTDLTDVVFRAEGPAGAVWLQMSYTALAPGDAGYAVLGVGTDVTARREAEAVLERMATHDALTGLPNRAGLAAAAAPLLAGREPLALGLLDLDRFKAVNDGHGHAAGDAVLQATAAAIVGALPARAIAGRWGGEEFLLLFPGAGLAAALAQAEAVRAAVAALSVVVEGRPDRLAPDGESGGGEAGGGEAGGGAPAGGAAVRVTASVGVAARAASEVQAGARDAAGAGAGSFEALVRAADAALYAAKAAGRDRVAGAGTARAA
jgi:diguanylate cyclase (GGDEF)-like protein